MIPRWPIHWRRGLDLACGEQHRFGVRLCCRTDPADEMISCPSCRAIAQMEAAS